MTETLTKNYTGEKGILVHSLRAWSIMAEKEWYQEYGVVGNIVPIVKKQREMNYGVKLAFSFLLSLGPHSMESDCQDLG